MKEISTWSGAYFYDFFAVGAVIALLLRVCAGARPQFNEPRRKWWRSTRSWALVWILLAGPYAILGLADADKFYIRDFRPLIFLLQIVVLVYLGLHVRREVVTARFVSWLAIAAGASVLAKYGVILTGIYQQADVYYQDSSYRYLDASAYFCAAFSLFYFSDRAQFERLKWLAWIALALSIVAVLITNSRFIVLSLVAGAFFVSNISAARRIGLALFGACAVSVFVLASYYAGIERVLGALTWEGLSGQVVSRYSPALERIHEMSAFQLIFGMGQGTPFDIPWFEYRGLESDAASIDGAYLTYYVKYGIFGPLMLLAYYCVQAPMKTSFRIPIGVFVACMFCVSTTSYQPYAVGLSLALFCFNALSVRTEALASDGSCHVR
ncbi:hypothetical protein D7T58_07170 [Stenotrophomonas maltophilia]|nr:hypothetical protein [Stenotrophomonas maltophilia]MBA0468479.1 hypothetical protein [Stenotrophomonas maltophilia]MBA0484800.1 hypothetical protein [Stenotrophomonas maltophilia]